MTESITPPASEPLDLAAIRARFDLTDVQCGNATEYLNRLYASSRDVPALLAELEQTRAERDLLRGERDWLLRGLDDRGRAEFHQLAQTRERAVAELGRAGYSALLGRAYGASPAAVPQATACGHGCTTWCSTTNACPLDAVPVEASGGEQGCTGPADSEGQRWCTRTGQYVGPDHNDADCRFWQNAEIHDEVRALNDADDAAPVTAAPSSTAGGEQRG